MSNYRTVNYIDENGNVLCTFKAKFGTVHIDSQMHPNKIVYTDEFGNIEHEEDMRPEYVENKLRLEELKIEIKKQERSVNHLKNLGKYLKTKLINMLKIS